MATAEPRDSYYLASLDKCLKEGYRLISFKQAVKALSAPNGAAQFPNLQHFIADERSIAQLRFPFDPFSPATPDTKKDLETRTAAIHITPPRSALYDVEELKADALWLAGETKIDEVAALRIVVLEWQDRPANQLLTGYTEGELISIQQAVGASGLSLSAFLQHYDLPEPGPASKGQKFFEQESRRVRLLQLYLSEREHVAALYLLLAVENGLGSPIATASSGNVGLGIYPVLPQDSWAKDAWSKIEESVTRSAKRSVSLEGSQLVSQGIQAMEERLSALENGSGWTIAQEQESEELESVFLLSKLAECLYILKIILTHISAVQTSPDSDTLREWFTFTDRYGFFEHFQPPFEYQQALVEPLQILISLVSLQIIRLPNALEQLDSLGMSELEKLPYFDLQTFECINDTLFNAAEHQSSVASPVLLAWSVILQNLRLLVQSKTIEDIPDPSSSPIESRRDSLLPSNTIMDLMNNVLGRSSSKLDAIQYLAQTALDTTNVFGVMTQICRNLASLLNSSDCRMLEYHCRMGFMETIRQGVLLASYGPEVLEATLATLNCRSQTEDAYKSSTQDLERRLLRNFMNDELVLVPGILEQARMRYPYEMMPFLMVAKAFSSVKSLDADDHTSPLTLFENSSRFTALLPKEFVGYESVREDENANFVRLAEDLPLFVDLTRRRILGGRDPTTRSLSLAGTRDDESGELIIPRGTDGSVLNESKPFVVMWFYEHSTFKYFARLLSRVASARNEESPQGLGTIERDMQSGIISLFATQLCTLTRPANHAQSSANDLERARYVLEEASDGLGRNQDLVTVIFDIFEGELSRQAYQSAQDTVNDLLASCIHFFRAVTQIIPNRAWPMLMRSELLEIDGHGGRMSGVMSSADPAFDRLGFVMHCLDLFDALLDDILANAVSRQSSESSTAVVRRFSGIQTQPSALTPEKMINKVISALTRAIVDILRSSSTWRFDSTEQQAYLTSRILKAFQRILETVYGFDDTQSISKKLTSSLAPSAEYILHAFISPDAYDTTMQFLLSICLKSTRPTASVMSQTARLHASSQCQSIMNFISTVLEIGMLTQASSEPLLKQLFHAVPLFIRMYSKEEPHRSTIVGLLSSMVKAAGVAEKDPPSLLGNLTQDTAKQFLSVLGYRNKPLGEYELGNSIWMLMADILSNRQPWFTTLLLTGDPPKRAASKAATDNDTSGGCRDKQVLAGDSPTMLALVLSTLASTDTMSQPREIAMLKFLATAQASWPWVTRSIRNEPEVCSNLLNFIAHLDKHLSKNEEERAHQLQAASLISEILAMYLHNSWQVGEMPKVEDFVPKLSFLCKNALAVPDYNSSLHNNLKKNFERCFNKVSPSSFKRLLGPASYGKTFFYDLDFASTTLGFSSSWNNGNGKGRGFAAEIERANLNLSVVETQVKLAQSWRSLATELCRSMSKAKAVQEQLILVIGQCLSANVESNLHEVVFDSLTQMRVDLALVLLQRLVSSKVDDEAMLPLVNLVWEAIQASGQDFELAFTGNCAVYYRSLLQVLLLAIQPFTLLQYHQHGGSADASSAKTPLKGMSQTVKMMSVLLNISSEVVGKGFKSLATQLHEDPSTVRPADFALLTSILQTILRLQDNGTFVSQATLRLCDLRITRYATALFSWSNKLTSSDGDPIYGELSISFLRELSTVRDMAKFMATESLLAQLSTASLLEHFRSRANGIGPFDIPYRMHAIWARGILPIVLNLLVAVGEFFALEATSFLNSFRGQLARSSTSLSTKATASNNSAASFGITLNMVSELHTLSLLSMALAQYRASPASAAVGGEVIPELAWDASGVREDLETWLGGRRSTLRERIVPVTEREVILLRTSPSLSPSVAAAAQSGQNKAGSESRLEELIVDEMSGALTCLNALLGTNGNGTSPSTASAAGPGQAQPGLPATVSRAASMSSPSGFSLGGAGAGAGAGASSGVGSTGVGLGGGLRRGSIITA